MEITGGRIHGDGAGRGHLANTVVVAITLDYAVHIRAGRALASTLSLGAAYMKLLGAWARLYDLGRMLRHADQAGETGVEAWNLGFSATVAKVSTVPHSV
jgi:hypothetical protein